jgi:hypothetical protein
LRSRISTTVAAPCRASSAVRSSHASATTTSWRPADGREAGRQQVLFVMRGYHHPDGLDHASRRIISFPGASRDARPIRHRGPARGPARAARQCPGRSAWGRSAWPHPCQPRSPAPPTGQPGHCPAARVRYPGAERRGPGSSARRWLSTPAGRRAAGQRPANVRRSRRVPGRGCTRAGRGCARAGR